MRHSLALRVRGTVGASSSPPYVQPLEGRVLLAAAAADQPSIDLVDGTVVVTGTEASDQVLVAMYPSATPGGPERLSVSANPLFRVFDLGGIAGVSIDGRGGGDALVVSRFVTISAKVRGGDGNDFVYAGGGRNDISGGAGTDTVSFDDRDTPVFVSLDDRADDGPDRLGNVRSDIENVIGGLGDDVIVGSAAANRLEGGFGNDTLWGADGDDVLLGGPGDDVLLGGAGADALGGASGHDTLDGVREPDDAPQDYPAEGAVLSGPVVRADNRGFEGSGYVDYVKNTGDLAVFTVDIGVEGEYTLTFRYANGSAADRPLRLNVNDRITRRLSFPPTGGWDQWRTVTVQVALERNAMNAVSLRTDGANGPNLDTLLVTPADLSTPAQPLPQTHQAEDSRRNGTIISSTHPGYTAQGYVDFNFAEGEWVEWEVQLPAEVEGPDERPVTLDFRYANGSSSDRPLELRVNGQVVQARLSFPPTGSWSSWRAASIAPPASLLRAGVDTIRLRAIGSSGPNLDAMTIRRADEPLPGPLTLEAESAEFRGAKVAGDWPGYTGSGYVDVLEPAGAYVEWTVTVGQAGLYDLDFRYANGSSARTMVVTVDGTAPPGGRFAFAGTGSWSTWADQRVRAQLSAGTNRVRVTAVGSSGPNFDSLTIRPV